MALTILVLVGAAASSIAIGLRLETRSSLQETRRIQLVALSDAAMAETLAELARNRRFAGVTERLFDKGTLASTVRPLGLDRYEIVTTARVTGRERRVRAEILITSSGPSLLTWNLVG